MFKFASGVLALLAVGAAQAAEVPKRLTSDSRLGELTYGSNQVFLVRVREGVATHIVLDRDEKIVSSAPGQSADCRNEAAAWCIVANVGANSLYVKARHPAAGSNNLELVTDKRLYSFEFVRNVDAMYRITFLYPDAKASHVAAARGGASATCNWSYSMAVQPGSADMAPLAAFDDGTSTYLVMPDDQMPQVFTMSANGVEYPLAVRKRGARLLVLPQVGHAFTVRRGAKQFRLWNERADARASQPAPCPPILV